MKFKKPTFSQTCLVILIFLASFRIAVDENVVNYYGISETIAFDNLDYKLAWSSHPTESYYKHEYVPAGDTVDRFHDMVMIDFLQTDHPLKDGISAQVKVIVDRKRTDQVCNYQILKKSDNEYILDFIMSEGNSQNVNVVEWNAYHYSLYTDKAGHRGILMFGISHRSYEDQVTPFLKMLSTYKNGKIKALSMYYVPEIQIK